MYSSLSRRPSMSYQTPVWRVAISVNPALISVKSPQWFNSVTCASIWSMLDPTTVKYDSIPKLSDLRTSPIILSSFVFDRGRTLP